MTTPARSLGLALLVTLAACEEGDGLDPITVITGPRVLAITTEPSALSVDGELQLTALTVDADGPRLGIGATASPGERPVAAVRMRACAPWKLLADPARDCPADAAVPLEHDAAGRFRVSAGELAAAFPSPPGTPAPPDPWRAALAAGLDLRVPVIAEVEVDGQTLVARRDVVVVDPGIRRQNPGLVEVRFDGSSTRTLAAGRRYQLTVVVDRASLDDRPEVEPSGELERVDCNFYSPAGELSGSEASLADPEAAETAPIAYTAGARGPTWLFVVATDETGGMTATSVPLTIE